MAGLGIGIAWVGYSILYYGVTQVQGGNWGLLDLMLPSRWATASGTPKDGGSSGPPPVLPLEASGPANARKPAPGFPRGVPTPGFSPTPIK